MLLCPTLQEGGRNYGWFRELDGNGEVEFGILEKDKIASWVRTSSNNKQGSDHVYDAEGVHSDLKELYRNLLASPST